MFHSRFSYGGRGNPLKAVLRFDVAEVLDVVVAAVVIFHLFFVRHIVSVADAADHNDRGLRFCGHEFVEGHDLDRGAEIMGHPHFFAFVRREPVGAGLVGINRADHRHLAKPFRRFLGDLYMPNVRRAESSGVDIGRFHSIFTCQFADVSLSGNRFS